MIGQACARPPYTTARVRHYQIVHGRHPYFLPSECTGWRQIWGLRHLLIWRQILHTSIYDGRFMGCDTLMVCGRYFIWRQILKSDAKWFSLRHLYSLRHITNIATVARIWRQVVNLTADFMFWRGMDQTVSLLRCTYTHTHTYSDFIYVYKYVYI